MLFNIQLFVISLCLAGLSQLHEFASLEEQYSLAQGDNGDVSAQLEQQLTALLTLQEELSTSLLINFFTGIFTLDECKQAALQLIDCANKVITQFVDSAALTKLSQKDAASIFSKARQNLRWNKQNIAEYLQQIFEVELKPLFNAADLFNNLSRCYQQLLITTDAAAQQAYFLAALNCLVFTKSDTVFALDNQQLNSLVATLTQKFAIACGAKSSNK